MRKVFNLTKGQYLVIITLLLAVYYLVCGIYLNSLGYLNQETLFYVEKVRIIFEGVGDKLKIIGLTSPAVPFFTTFAFTFLNHIIAPVISPVIASALGTAVLFYLMASTLIKKTGDNFYLFLLIVLFVFHPGILYAACSGKAIYMVLIFFYMFFLNIFKFYTSNTTFHISIASICLVLLLFCDYKFIWLTLFFLPLIFSIALQSLNLAEKESIFRMMQSFNSPSLRRKLVNKTFALYMILFILPVASVICYKLLNLTNANDANYFMESPYANWNVLAERSVFEKFATNGDFDLKEISLLITAKMVAFCPLIILAIYLFRRNSYQILTLLTPFAFVEFLHVKYDKAFLTYQYYLIFLILAVLCFILKAKPIKRQMLFKAVLSFIILVQLCTGYLFLSKSLIDDERNFITMLVKRTPTDQPDDNRDMANYINSLPKGSKILADDAAAYPIVVFTNNISTLILPYQDYYLSAIERPRDFARYVLIATPKNLTGSYSALNSRYAPIAYQNSDNKVYETDNWTLYKLY